MRRRYVALVIVALVAGTLVLFMPPDDSQYRDAFDLKAVYDEGIVRVTFVDKTGMADSAVLEVLGMRESFQREFDGSFQTNVEYGPPPSLGWKVSPVTVAVDHPELGRVGVKTEVRGPGDPEPTLVFGPL